MSLGSNRAMREVNRGILLDLIRVSGRISRADLAKRSKLTKPTVSAIVERLIADGLVRELGFGRSDRAGGRPPRILEFVASSSAYVGIHIGLRATTVALADALGTVLVERSAPSHPYPEVAAETVRTLLEQLLTEADLPLERVAGVVACVPGLVDRATGACVLAPNLRWHYVPLQQLLADALGVPVQLYNITHASAVAEGRVGVAQGARSFVWVYVGSGVGSGVVLDGQLHLGHQGFSGEIGHCIVDDAGPPCGCGLRGCLEAHVSGMAIAARARALVAAGQAPGLAHCDPLDAAAVSAAAQANDPAARAILSDAGAHLGKGVSYLVHLLDPELVVIGGGVADAGDLLLEPMRTSLADHTLPTARTRVVPSALGSRAALIGCVLLAMEMGARPLRIVEATGASAMRG